MRRLGSAIARMADPAIEKIAAARKADPFQVLIATMLSAQTKDAVTFEASTRLFSRAATVRQLAQVSVSRDRAVDLSGELLPEQGPPT